MKMRVEATLLCHQVTEDDDRDEVYFLVASAAGGAETVSRLPPGDPGYWGFRGDAPSEHTHLPIWEGGLPSEPMKLSIVVMEQDNDTLGDSGRQILEDLVAALSAAPGVISSIVGLVVPVLRKAVRLFANKHDVVGAFVMLVRPNGTGGISAEFGIPPDGSTTTFSAPPTDSEAQLLLTGAGSKYSATIRVALC